jgi:hypothetical protein
VSMPHRILRANFNSGASPAQTRMQVFTEPAGCVP